MSAKLKLLWSFADIYFLPRITAGNKCLQSSIAVCVPFYEFVILSIKDFNNQKHQSQ